MCKVMQLYGLTPDEALKLTDSQINLMLEQADNVAASLLSNNPTFKQALNQRLAPVKRAVRAVLEDGAPTQTPSGSSGGSGGPVGPPPSY